MQILFDKAGITLGIVFLLVTQNLAVEKSNLKNEIFKSINTSAEYAMNILLDEDGKSRCDYNIITGEWQDYEPPWHTGQIIFGLTRAYDITKDERFLEAAKKAGNWWVDLEIKDHPKLEGMVKAIHGDGINYIIFATVSDGSAGLFRLYDITGIKKYAQIPTQAGDWMYANMYEPESRMFFDAVDPETGNVMTHWSPFWPDRQNQTLNDVARPNNEGSLFKDMYEYTGNKKYKKIFLDLCESLVAKQGEEGLWMDFTPNDKGESSFHPRFNIWYAESLLEGYDLTKDINFLNAALKTARFYTKFQLKDGAFYYKNFLDGSADKYSISGSTTAFAGMLWLRLLQLGVGDEFAPYIEKSLQWTLENQYPLGHPDKNLAGSILEIRTKSKNGKIIMLNRDIATSFALRFLADYYEYKFQK